MADAICSMPDCPKKVLARTWCATHYQRWKRHGDPTFVMKTSLAPGAITLDEKLKARYDIVGECWRWLGARTPNGYGTFRFKNRTQPVHRWAYEEWVGPIPEGLEIDHLCRTRDCINPDHLEAVTRAENMRRATPARGADHGNGRKTHCPQGHEYTPENTYERRGRRYCRVCRKAAMSRYWAKQAS